MSTKAQQVRVEEEAPDSELPEGWAEPHLPEVCVLNPPKPPSDALSAEAPVTFVPMPAVDAEEGTIHNPSTRPYYEVRKGFTSFKDGDVIMAKITPCMENGKAAIARDLINGLGFGSTEFHVMRSNDSIDPEYLFHFIRQESFRRAAENEMTGSVGQKRVPVSFLETTVIPLPPIAEQQRIAAKITETFGQTRSTRSRLGKVSSYLKRFRQAVLAAACSGKLTEDWREHNPEVYVGAKNSDAAEIDLPQGWQIASLAEVAEKVQDGNYGALYPKSHEWIERRGVAFIIPAALAVDGTIDLDKIRYITRDRNACLKKAQLAAGDVIFPNRGSREAQRYGLEPFAISISEDFLPANINPQLTLVRPNTNIIESGFLRLALNSEFFLGQVRDATGGSALSFINLTVTKRLQIPLPRLPEQAEIFRRVEALFKLADAIERRVAAATLRAEKLTQAILAKAFRGELVPTEAELARREGRDYESASALLERIKEEKRQNGNARVPLKMRKK